MDDNKLVNPFCLNLPSNITEMTIGDLIHSDGVEIHAKGGKVSVRKSTDNGVATFQFDTYSTGRQTSQISSIPPREKKSDYIDDIAEMRRSGMKQKDIAFALDISTSYVSQLVKKYGL